MQPAARPRPRHRRRTPAAVRAAVWLALGLIVFGIGVAVGEAIHDNPSPGGTITYIRTLKP